MCLEQSQQEIKHLCASTNNPYSSILSLYVKALSKNSPKWLRKEKKKLPHQNKIKMEKTTKNSLENPKR